MGSGRADKTGTYDKARDKAMRLLGIRSRSSLELRQHLLASGFCQEVTEAVIARLIETGLLNDRRFALERARAMGKGKGWGPRKLRSDLIRRGVCEEMVEEAICQAYGGHTCAEVMRRLIKKRFGGEVLTQHADRKVRGKAQRYLLGKGFEPDEVFQIFTEA